MPTKDNPMHPALLADAELRARGAAPDGYKSIGLFRRAPAASGDPELIYYVYAPEWWVDRSAEAPK